MPELNTVTDPNLPEPKGASTASQGMIYLSDGAGSGSWKHLPSGWAYYQDGGSGQSVGTSQTLLTNNKAGTGTYEDKLPYEIRGSGTLWSANTLTPINDGDAYNVRLDLPVTAKTGSPSSLELILDIGGSGVGATIPIVRREVSVNNAPPFTLSLGFPIHCRSTFLSNGGQFYLKTDTGTVTVTNPAIHIAMDHSGEL